MPKTPSIGLRLLRTIKRFPELYNSDHDLADDVAHSMVVWDTISYELDTPVTVLKKKWQKLRSSHRKKCRNFENRKSAISLPQDEVFHLMTSILEFPGGDSLSDRDDSSVCSAPAQSIISEEDRSTRSSSSSTLVAEIGVSDFGHVDSSGLKKPAELIRESKNTSTRILRSAKSRTTRSGPPEVTKNREKDRHCSNSTPKNFSICSSYAENREKNFDQFNDSCQNEPVRTFFESMALTVAKFPRHIQATTKTKICSIVAKAELKLSSPGIR